MEPIRTIEAPAVALPIDNIDTDQIIPARFLSTTTRDGLGAALFADWRYAPDGTADAGFVLSSPVGRRAGVLVTGDNFGCGSSREHAPWALRSFGILAVASTSFADIFRNNALANGLLPVELSGDAHAAVLAAVTQHPGARVVIDVAAQTLRVDGGEAFGFPLEPFAKHCLMHGLDRLGFLLEAAPVIAEYEARAGVAALTTEPR